jgi:predicted nucleotidyltransferase
MGELVLGGAHALLGQVRELVRPLLSRRIAHHYRGFATSQRRAFEDKPTAKRALYVLRTAATGRHLMAHGEIVTDVARLGAFIPDEISELLELKRGGEKTELDAERAQVWRTRLVTAIDAIDQAWPSSVLPPEPPADAIAAVDAWLRDARHARW